MFTSRFHTSIHRLAAAIVLSIVPGFTGAEVASTHAARPGVEAQPTYGIESNTFGGISDTGLYPFAPSFPAVESETKVADQSNQIRVFLPLVLHDDSQPAAYGEASKIAIDLVNFYRSLAGVHPLEEHPSIVAAGQGHADYYMLNYNDPSAWTYGVHGEVYGKPAFTGKWPSDRIKAAGFPWLGGSEVMHFIGDPVASVNGWIDTVYHRVILLDPGAYFAGYGNGKNNQAAVDVLVLGSDGSSDGAGSAKTPYPLAYPGDGQVGVPTSWSGLGSPDSLPPGASRPVGYPFTLQGAHGKLQVEWAEMRQAGGNLVSVHPNPPHCDTFNCFALIAVSPLSPNTTYTVRARGSVGGVTFDRTWRFTTGSTGSQEAGWESGIHEIGAAWWEPTLIDPQIFEDE